MDENKTWNVVSYLLNQGVQVIPLAPDKKYPTMKGWQNYNIQTPKELECYIKTGHGFGIKPNGDWCYFDLDGDHVEGVNGVETFYSAFENISDAATIYAKKPNSDNLHLFYRNNIHSHERYTGNDAIADGVEFSARDSQVRIEPAYEFKNLDLGLPFLEQLSLIPEQLEPALMPVARPKRQYKPAKARANNIARYLAACEPFPEGERSSSYRKLIYTMVIKWGMPYDEVKPAVDSWDKENGGYQFIESGQYEHATRDPLTK